MNILSFCKSIEFGKFIDFEVVQAMESDIPNLDISSLVFQAILVDDCQTIKMIKTRLERRARLMIPIIMLLRQNSSYGLIRQCIDTGASDFSMDPFSDLKDIIINKFNLYDEILDLAESKLHQLRKTLMYSIPHEFNTPLTSILGLVTIMTKEPLSEPESIKKFSANIMNSTIRLQKVIENFTYYSHLQIKLSSDREIAYARSFVLSNPDQLIKLVIHDLQYSYQRKIKHSLSPGSLHCNETNFYKLVYYILENALKFSMDESMVMVGAYPLDKEYQIVIYNEDSGFDAEQLKFLGAFTQFDREIQEQQGMGMGIAIVLSLLKLYDGRIKIFSEKNKYTKIEIYLKN